MGTLFGEKAPLDVRGPKIRFQGDVPWELFERPGIRAMLRAISMEAPPTVDGVVVVTSTWRPFAESGGFSYHNRCDALDVRTGVDGPTRPGSIVAPTRDGRIAIARDWAVRMKLRLGVEFDVIFGDARHIDHFHLEHDGLKAMLQHEPPDQAHV